MSTTTGQKNLNPQRRLEGAIEYVSRTWFPANPEILSAIQETLAAGGYENNLTALVQDVKRDFSLFTYCLKSLRDLYPPEYADRNPLTLLKHLDSSTIKKLLSVPGSEISTHDFAAMEKCQAIRMKHLVLSTSTAEILAYKNSINSEEVYTLSVLRQLGVNLIAWNYPSIYMRSITALRDGSELDLEEILGEHLGFSPHELAAALTLPPALQQSLAADLGIAAKDLDETGSLTQKLCEIGEAFAILNDPENYPGGTPRSKTVIAEINHVLGPNGVALIHEVANRKYVSYVSKAPDVFAVDNTVEQNIEKASLHYGSLLYTKNPYVNRLTPALQARIREVYSKLLRGQVSTEALQMLAVDVIPNAGFHRGCIFLVDQKSMVLVPRLRIGNETLARYRRYDSMNPNQGGNPIVDALFCAYPIKQEGTFVNGEWTSFVAGALGGTDRAGVLYLEMLQTFVDDPASDPMTIFKALRHCLNDCLNLR